MSKPDKHDTDYADWMEMVERGEATRRAGNSLTGGDDCFFMTSSGAKLALHPGERLDPEDFPAAKLDSQARGRTVHA